MATPSAVELIRFHCPHCGKTMRAPAKQAGQKGPCARCGAQILVPKESESIPAVAVEAEDFSSSVQELRHSPLGDADLIDGFSLPVPPKPVSTLDDLKEYAETRAATMTPRLRRTPLWMWVLHLSLPIATACVLLWIYKGRSRPSVEAQPPTHDLEPIRIPGTGSLPRTR